MNVNNIEITKVSDEELAEALTIAYGGVDGVALAEIKAIEAEMVRRSSGPADRQWLPISRDEIDKLESQLRHTAAVAAAKEETHFLIKQSLHKANAENMALRADLSEARGHWRDWRNESERWQDRWRRQARLSRWLVAALFLAVAVDVWYGVVLTIGGQ